MYDFILAYMLSLSFFLYLFIGLLLVSDISCFPFLLLHLLKKFRLNYTHELNQHT